MIKALLKKVMIEIPKSVFPGCMQFSWGRFDLFDKSDIID